MMKVEGEFARKFLVSYVPEGLLEIRSPVLVRHGYLTSDAERYICVCDEGGSYSMTINQGIGGRRKHTTIALSDSQFSDLWPLTSHMQVEKERYRIAFFGDQLLIDVFKKSLAPLTMLEVQFDNESSCRQFLPPDFADIEVSHYREYTSMSLAKFGLPDMTNTHTRENMPVFSV